MKTKTVGEILKEQRLEANLSLQDLAKESRIRVEYLEALEKNDFAKLPAATFVKGYIKIYSRILGFDFQPIIALLRRDFKESAKGKLVPREFIKSILTRRKTFTPITNVFISLALIFLVLFSYVGFQWYNFNKPPELVIYTPEEDAFVSTKVMIEGKTNPEAVVLVNSEPISLSTDGKFKTEIYLPREGVATITIEATDKRGKTSLISRTVYVRF